MGLTGSCHRDQSASAKQQAATAKLVRAAGLLRLAG